MDFVTELLESFSKVHGRKLRLLEQEADPRIEKASQVIAGKVGQGIPAQTMKFEVENKTPNTDKPTVKVEAYSKGGIRVGGRLATWDGNSIASGKNPKDFAAILTMLAGPSDEPEKEETEEEKARKIAGEGAVAGESIGQGQFDTEEAREAASNAFFRMSAFIQGAFDRIGKSATKYKSAFFGRRAESLERRLSESNKYLVYNREFDGFTFEEGVLPDSSIVGISETLENMMRSLATEECPTGQQAFTKNIRKTGRGELVFSPYADADLSEALVFTDDKGLLKDTIEEAFKACDEDGIPEISILSDDVGGGSDNNTLGTGFELFQKVAILMLRANQIKQSEGKIPEGLAQEIALASRQLRQKMEKLSDAARTAFLVQKTAGLSPEDSEIVNNLKELFTSDKEGSLYKRMLELSLAIVRDRNPEFITEAGQETRFGNRQDIREYFSTEEKARKALEKSGLNPDNYKVATLDEMVEKGHMSEREKNAAIESGLASSGDDQIFVCKTSMKAYKSLKHVTWGKGSENSQKEMMQEPLDGGPHAGLINTMLDDLGVSKRNRSEAWREMQEYNNNIDSISRDISKVPYEAIVTTRGGEKIKADAGKTFVDMLDKQLTDNSTYDQLTKGERSTIKRKLEYLKDKYGDTYTAGALYERLQKEVSTMLTYKKVENDLNSGDPERSESAKRWLASKMYHAGGSDDPKLNETAISWSTGESQVFSRNDVLRDIVRGKGGWDVNTDKSDFSKGLIVYSSGDASVALNTNPKPSRTKGQKTIVNNETTLSVNKATNQRYDKRKSKENSSTIVKALDGLREALGIIQEKVAVININ